jgi:tryptophan-rich sensory protein
MHTSWLIIILFILGCISAYKAFNAENQKEKRLYGFIALFIGGVLFFLGNPGFR